MKYFLPCIQHCFTVCGVVGILLLFTSCGEKPDVSPKKTEPNVSKAANEDKARSVRDGGMGVVRTSEKAENDELERAIHLCADYLVRNCGADGRFNYLINPKLDFDPAKYNMLRHAGTLYSLALYARSFPDKNLKTTLLQGLAYLKKNIRCVDHSSDMLAVWSTKAITGKSNPETAKLGGTGLGLVAMLEVDSVIPDSTPLETLEKMGAFLLFMQNEDGSFVSKYIPSQGGKNTRWRSLYYPGEAALGLAMLYNKVSSESSQKDLGAKKDEGGAAKHDRTLKSGQRWLLSAAKALAYLSRVRQGKTNVEADHWALLATAALLPVYDHCETPPVEKKALVEHGIQICENMLRRSAKHDEDSLDFGCFSGDTRTCPTAIRLEGLIAALSFIPSDKSELRRRIIKRIKSGVDFLIRCQLESGKLTGGIPRARREFPKDHRYYSSKFNRRAPEVRIDYVQHAMCAMLEYRSLLRKSVEN